MTSVNRSLSDINTRVRYFTALATTTHYRPISGFKFESIMTAAAFTGAVNSVTTTPAGTMYKDMGKSVTIVDFAGVHQSLYRLVQLVNGITSEGVSGATNDQFYIRVWSSDLAASPVTVARVG